jgi:hypothetical protein
MQQVFHTRKETSDSEIIDKFRFLGNQHLLTFKDEFATLFLL